MIFKKIDINRGLINFESEKSLNFISLIRKILLTYTYGYAPEEFKIFKNTTKYPDEIICKRISLIPFKNEGIIFLNESKKRIYSSDFTSENVEPIFKDIFILDLYEGSLDLEIKVVKGLSKMHAKFQNVLWVKILEEKDEPLFIEFGTLETLDAEELYNISIVNFKKTLEVVEFI